MKPPYTPEELREKIKSGELRIVSAPQVETDRYEEELLKLLRMIAVSLEAENPDDWTDHVYITDESSVGDFLLDQADVTVLVGQLGFQVDRSSLLVDVAARMRGVN